MSYPSAMARMVPTTVTPPPHNTEVCVVCERYEERLAADIVRPPLGAVAQLVERIHGMDEAARSIRVSSTADGFAEAFHEVGDFFGGLVAAEGSFGILARPETFVADDSPRLRFRFQLAMA